MKYTKKQLADLAIKLFDNIDQADQFANPGTQNEMFYHCDKAFLLKLIEDFMECVEQNRQWHRYLLSDEDELDEMLAEAKKVLGMTDDEDSN